MVSLTTLHYGGYPDALTFLLVFGAWWARGRLVAATPLFFLAAMSHESALFLAPWILAEWAREPEDAARGWLRAGAGMAVVGIAFVGARLLMERTHPATEYSFAYYARPLLEDPLHWFRASSPHRTLGILAAFNLLWLFPILAAARHLKHGVRGDAIRLLLPVPLALAQLFIAYDVTRLATLAFMSVLLGAEELLRTNGFAARLWAPWLCAANFLIPQVNVAMGVIDPMGR